MLCSAIACRWQLPNGIPRKVVQSAVPAAEEGRLPNVGNGCQHGRQKSQGARMPNGFGGVLTHPLNSANGSEPSSERECDGGRVCPAGR